MTKFKLCMAHWHDGFENSTRRRNVLYTWNDMKNLSRFLNENGLDTEARLYDFSEKQDISDATVHKSYPTGVYKRSEKMNFIIFDKALDDSFIIFFDADVFIRKNEWNNFHNLLNKIEDSNIKLYRFALLKLHDAFEFLSDDILEKNINEGNHHLPFHGNCGSHGAFFITDINTLREVGGFDTSYTTWGGEDGEITGRIANYIGNYGECIDSSYILPIHISHFTDWGNPLYFGRS